MTTGEGFRDVERDLAQLRLEVGAALYPDPLAEPESVRHALRLDARMAFPSDKGLQVRNGTLGHYSNQGPSHTAGRVEPVNRSSR